MVAASHKVYYRFRSWFLLCLTQQRGQRPIAPDSGLRGGGISSGQVDGEDLHDVESNVSLLDLVRSALN